MLDHVSAAGLGKEKGAGEVDVEEPAEHVGIVGFSFDIGARRQFTRLVKGFIFIDSKGKITPGECPEDYTYSTIPAELMRMSIEPKSEAICSIVCLLADASRTSVL